MMTVLIFLCVKSRAFISTITDYILFDTSFTLMRSEESNRHAENTQKLFVAHASRSVDAAFIE